MKHEKKEIIAMTTIITVIGILIIISSLVWACQHVSKGRTHITAAVSIAAIGVLVGLGLTMRNRIVEFTINRIGSFKAQAEADAGDIAEIKKRVEAQSATVDLVAKEAEEAKRLYEDLAHKHDLADENLASIVETMKAMNKNQEATTEILGEVSNLSSELQLLAKFTMTVDAAQNDDRHAFDELKSWAFDASHPFSARSIDVVNAILRKHDSAMLSIPLLRNTPSVNYSTMSMEELIRRFHNVRSSDVESKVAHIRVIGNRKDFSRKDRMQFLIDIIKTNLSLYVVEHAGRLFAEESQLEVKPLAVEEMLDWWESNKDQIK